MSPNSIIQLKIRTGKKIKDADLHKLPKIIPVMDKIILFLLNPINNKVEAKKNNASVYGT
jgi:hypothetical protein